MKQMARNPTDPFDGCLRGNRYLIMDRDTKFTRVWTACSASTTVTRPDELVRLSKTLVTSPVFAPRAYWTFRTVTAANTPRLSPSQQLTRAPIDRKTWLPRSKIRLLQNSKTAVQFRDHTGVHWKGGRKWQLPTGTH